jgi:CheY-like chemotaxis protein
MQRRAVLVVEDEPLLLMLSVEIVEDAGLEPVEAANADESLLILEARDNITSPSATSRCQAR